MPSKEKRATQNKKPEIKRSTLGLNTIMLGFHGRLDILLSKMFNAEQSREDESASTRSCRIQVREILNENERKGIESREDERLG